MENIYSIEVYKGIFADVKIMNNFSYVMQNEDGTMLYDNNGNTFDFPFDEKTIINQAELIHLELTKF